MNKRLYGSLALVAGLALGTLPASADDMMAGGAAKVYAIGAQNGSGETGTVSLIPQGDKTIVEIALVGAPADAQPVHVHMGSCDKLNPAPMYPLKSLMNGYSETTLDVPMAKLTAGGMAVNAHKSTSDLKTYVACGNLGGGMMGGKM